MATTHLVDVEDERTYKAIDWLLREIGKYDYGEISVTVKKNNGIITSIEKTITHKEYKK